VAGAWRACGEITEGREYEIPERARAGRECAAAGLRSICNQLNLLLTQIPEIT